MQRLGAYLFELCFRFVPQILICYPMHYLSQMFVWQCKIGADVVKFLVVTEIYFRIMKYLSSNCLITYFDLIQYAIYRAFCTLYIRCNVKTIIKGIFLRYEGGTRTCLSEFVAG